MNALDCIDNITNTKLVNYQLKYCLVKSNKLPYTIEDKLARPNHIEDFVEFDRLLQHNSLEDYAGVGISIQASGICAIDIDHCFSKPFDIESLDNRAKYCIEHFKDSYIEFSFSGTGLRILFLHNQLDDYKNKYYIKNSKFNIEFYMPTESNRYVTITGKSINNVDIQDIDDEVLMSFLNEYMKRKVEVHQVIETKETRSFEEVLKVARQKLNKDMYFQDLWFKKAPGSRKNESELDYALIAYIYDYITTDKEFIRKIFEMSEFYKSKDNHHIYKWQYNNYRYFNFQYEQKLRR